MHLVFSIWLCLEKPTAYHDCCQTHARRANPANTNPTESTKNHPHQRKSRKGPRRKPLRPHPLRHWYVTMLAPSLSNIIRHLPNPQPFCHPNNMWIACRSNTSKVNSVAHFMPTRRQLPFMTISRQRPNSSKRVAAAADILNELADTSENAAIYTAFIWRYIELQQLWDPSHQDKTLHSASAFLDSLDQREFVKRNITLSRST